MPVKSCSGRQSHTVAVMPRATGLAMAHGCHCHVCADKRGVESLLTTGEKIHAHHGGLSSKEVPTKARQPHGRYGRGKTDSYQQTHMLLSSTTCKIDTSQCQPCRHKTWAQPPTQMDPTLLQRRSDLSIDRTWPAYAAVKKQITGQDVLVACRQLVWGNQQQPHESRS
jgi:hypothetical protein